MNTRRKKPLAGTGPKGRGRREQARAAVDALFRLRSRIARRIKGQAALSDAEVKSAIAQGRR